MNKSKIEENLILVIRFLESHRIGYDINRPVTPADSAKAIELIEEAIEELHKE